MAGGVPRFADLDGCWRRADLRFAAYRLTAKGLPFDGKRFPLQLSQADLENADLVVALKKAEHHPMMLQQFPELG